MHDSIEEQQRARGGVLLIRVWVEAGAPEQVRARLTAVGAVAGADATVATAARVRAICDAVEV